MVAIVWLETFVAEANSNKVGRNRIYTSWGSMLLRLFMQHVTVTLFVILPTMYLSTMDYNCTIYTVIIQNDLLERYC